MELHLSDRHIVALNFMLVTVLAYFGALAANDVVSMRSAAIETPVLNQRSRMADGSSSNQSRAAYQAIVERDIFNLVPPPAPPAQVVVEDLHLTLIGVSQATKGKPFAIVANQQGEQSVYRVGEMIPDSGKLLEVDKDHAVVEHGGKQVVLELPKNEMGDTSEGFAGSQPAPAPRRLTPSAASSEDALAHYRERLHRRYPGHVE